ncbi:MAG: cation:dicarboxylase symporter family transporter [Proteobacteria bacterium]|nr:cation:dicarboxylase symporter family transporter [Pseudomonadota bacterium]
MIRFPRPSRLPVNRQALLIFLGLMTGLTLGVIISRYSLQLRGSVSNICGNLGDIWLDGLRMTLVPLVFSLIFTGISTASETVSIGRAALGMLFIFAVLLILSGTVSAISASATLHYWPISSETAAALRGAAPSHATEVPAAPPLFLWLRSFVPSNPIKAAADGAMAPLVLFALAFSVAAVRQSQSRQAALFGFFDAVQATMLSIVNAVLFLAPFGVFCLSVSVGAKVGAGVMGLLGQYLAVVSLSCLLGGRCGFLTGLAGGGRPKALLKALLPVGAFALSTQSSVASLPLMLVATERVGIPSRIGKLVLPMAVALFRINNPAATVAIAIFTAKIYGIDLDPGHLAVGIAVAAVVSLGGAGVSSTVTFFATATPVCMAMNVPITLLPLLLPVEPLTDFSRTLGNTVADVGVTVFAGRGHRGSVPTPAQSGGGDQVSLSTGNSGLDG